MRCPKCHYISFDNGDRCRNCGYDFSLAVDVPAADLAIASAGAVDGPLADFALEDPRPSAPRAPDTASDLPLFARAGAERTAAAPAAAPRAPLAVRRASPMAGRDRVRVPDEPTLDLGEPDAPARWGRESLLKADDTDAEPDPRTARLVPRTAAALIDVVLLGAIQVAVVYLTLRLCGLTVGQLGLLPSVPLGAFLLMLAAGYLVSFTVAGGQTIGKMAARIRVVPIAGRDPGNARVTLASAVLRAIGAIVSILAAGLGYIPALLSRDHRALHDRLADTRVVRA